MLYTAQIIEDIKTVVTTYSTTDVHNAHRECMRVNKTLKGVTPVQVLSSYDLNKYANKGYKVIYEDKPRKLNKKSSTHIMTDREKLNKALDLLNAIAKDTLIEEKYTDEWDLTDSLYSTINDIENFMNDIS